MNNIKFRSNSVQPEVYNEIAKFVNNNPDTTLKILSDNFGIAVSTVGKILRRLNLKLKRKGCFSAKYEINENFFEKIDTPEKAQILGLIFADGTMSKYNKNISIRLNEKDTEYLKDVNKILDSTRPISFIKEHNMISPLNGKTYKAGATCILDISRAKMYKDLENLGVCCRKTYINVPMPNIPNELVKYFLLGLYEGDGCITCSFSKSGAISTCNFTVVVSESLGAFLKNFLENENEIEGVHLYKRGNIHLLQIMKIKSLLKLGDMLYGGSTSLYMKRKKDKWENIRKYLV